MPADSIKMRDPSSPEAAALYSLVLVHYLVSSPALACHPSLCPSAQDEKGKVKDAQQKRGVRAKCRATEGVCARRGIRQASQSGRNGSAVQP